MDFNETFTNLGVDPIEGADIMMRAGITVDQLNDMSTFSKVREIMAFFANRPDGKFVMTKLLTGKPGINAVDHLCSYAKLRTNYDTLLKQADDIKQQLYYYEK